jgi:magnesium transporter
MARFIKKRSGARGTQPGSLILIGEQQTDRIEISVMKYDAKVVVEKPVNSIEEAMEMIGDSYMTWINIFGIHDTKLISSLGEKLEINNLVLEDILNTDHRPRYSLEDEKLFFIAKLLTLNKETKFIESDQLSMIMGKNYLISFQEKPGKHFDAVRDRIRKSKDRLRIKFPDYLAYALLDCMVDVYMDIIAEIGGSIDNLEKKIMGNPGKETSHEIYRLRTELNYIRRIVLPLKELSFNFLKSKSPLIREDTRAFIADLHDHVVITHESIEVYYSLVADQLEIYNALISNRANEIMKVLTVFAAFFIPLTFIAGIYGMNFDHIPELHMKNGYLYFWILIALVAGVLTVYFKRKKWL